MSDIGMIGYDAWKTTPPDSWDRDDYPLCCEPGCMDEAEYGGRCEYHFSEHEQERLLEEMPENEWENLEMSEWDELRATMPAGGWVCFHCGEVFTTPGSAQDHFGAEPCSLAGCQIKAGEERGLLMALRKAEEEAKSNQEHAFRAEQHVEALECQVVSLTTVMQSYRPFRECRSIQDVFNVYDSMEGRALAAEEKVNARN